MRFRGGRARTVSIAAAVAVLVPLVVTTIGSSPALAARPFVITTVAGNGEYGQAGDGGPATQAQLQGPGKVISDPAGNIYIADGTVRRVDTAGVITTYAGGGSPDDGIGDGLPATQSLLVATGLGLDAAGNLFITDASHNTVRKVDASDPHLISTVAGDGSSGSDGDGGPATAAQLNGPTGVAVDSAGNLYIADQNNRKVRKVDSSTGQISTLASFTFEQRPLDIALDAGGNVFVASDDQTVLMVDPSGATSTYAGRSRTRGNTGDGGPATSALLFNPASVDVDATGQVYIADRTNQRIRKVDASPDHIITTVAGAGGINDPGFEGDGGDPLAARLAYPTGVGVDHHGGFFIGDTDNLRVRHVAPAPDLLAVTMTDSPHATLKVGGGPLTYAITVDNYSSTGQTATHVTMSQTLPLSLKLQSVTASQGTCARQSTVLTCALGSMAPDAEVTINVVVTPTVPGVFPSTATVRADQTDPLARDDSVTTSTFVSDASCGQVISQSTKLKTDIGPCAVSALIVRADNINVDLGGHRIFALPGLDVFDSIAGIRLPFRTGVTLHNGKVQGFNAGVLLIGGSGNTLTQLNLRDNIGPSTFDADLGDGIALFNSANNIIDSNVIIGNGNYDGIGVLGNSSSGNTISNNNIQNTVDRPRTVGRGQGIIINSGALNENTGILLTNETVVNNTIRGNASAGIATNNVSYSRFEGNVVERNGLPGFSNDANGIGMRPGPFAQTFSQHNLVTKNQIAKNTGAGIVVYSFDNTITFNSATGDVSYDLADQASIQHQDTCSNTWANNKYDTYFPVCVVSQASATTAAMAAVTAPAAAPPDFPSRHAS